MIAGRPAPCDPARERCPDKGGNLPAINVFKHIPCAANEGSWWLDPCEILRRYDAIVALDKALPADDLAGVYESLDGYGGVQLALAPDDWAAFRESSDVGPGPTLAGRYWLEGGNVILDLPDARRPPWIGARTVYGVVHWGPRLYLVRRTKLANFVNDVNRGFYRDNDWDSPFALPRRRDASEPLCGLPELPKEWAERLHPHPLLVTALHVEPDLAPPRDKREADDARYRIEVDAGLAAGMFPGMELESVTGDSTCGGPWLDVELDDVYADRAFGRLRVPDADKATLIAKGLKLTTGAKAWQPPACKAATMNGPQVERPSGGRRASGYAVR